MKIISWKRKWELLKEAVWRMSEGTNTVLFHNKSDFANTMTQYRELLKQITAPRGKRTVNK